MGFGLWSIPYLSAGIELVLVLVGAFLYYHAAMRAAVRAERADQKAGAATTATGYRQQALIASVSLVVSMLVVLVISFLGY